MKHGALCISHKPSESLTDGRARYRLIVGACGGCNGGGASGGGVGCGGAIDRGGGGGRGGG